MYPLIQCTHTDRYPDNRVRLPVVELLKSLCSPGAGVPPLVLAPVEHPVESTAPQQLSTDRLETYMYMYVYTHSEREVVVNTHTHTYTSTGICILLWLPLELPRAHTLCMLPQSAAMGSYAFAALAQLFSMSMV